MVVGTIMQAACFDYALFASGRIIGGIGNGMVSLEKPIDWSCGLLLLPALLPKLC